MIACEIHAAIGIARVGSRRLDSDEGSFNSPEQAVRLQETIAIQPAISNTRRLASVSSNVGATARGIYLKPLK